MNMRCHSPTPFADFEPRALARAAVRSQWIEPRAFACTAARTPFGSRTLARAVARRSGSLSAFTLVEMVVVVAIAVILLTIVLPAATSLWEQRKFADAQNTIQGLFTTARARAMRAGGLETGLFFYVDESGVQRIAYLKQRMKEDETSPNPAENPYAFPHVFRVTDDRQWSLPKPIRAVPLYVTRDPAEYQRYEVFDPVELVNDDFDRLLTGVGLDAAQRHRNYFTLIFTSEGQITVFRDVVIQDDDEDQDGSGDKTGLCVVGTCSPPIITLGTENPPIMQYYGRTDSEPVPLDVTGAGAGLKNLITGDSGDRVAVNFPSVDGVLVHDDSLFHEVGGDPKARRAYLLKSAQPFYVNRASGALVKGPRAENEPN